MKLYSQRAAAYARHALGYGPGHTTLGIAGCLVTDFAMIANDSGHATDPGKLDEAFSAHKLYLPEGGGLYDLCTDNMLDRLWPGRYKTTVYSGYAKAAVATAVPTKDTYVVLWIHTAKVPTHFVIAYSSDASLIADPWTGAVGRLSGYGGQPAVHKTLLIKALPAPAPTPPITPIPVEPSLPALPLPAPPPPDVLAGLLQQLLVALLRILLSLRGQIQP